MVQGNLLLKLVENRDYNIFPKMTQLLTTKDLAELMQVKLRTIYRWVEKNKVPFIKLPGGDIRFDPDKIDNWLRMRTARVKQ
jgi:excisionase family DNA binding protein